jgi:hypothetical protein
MASEKSLSYSFIAGIAALVGVFASSLLLVVVELMAALLTYFYLSIFQRDWFGWLIGYSREILNFCIGQLELWFPAFSNQANATLIGELAPKSMLLLLIGLVVGALIRLFLWILKRAYFSVAG